METRQLLIMAALALIKEQLENGMMLDISPTLSAERSQTEIPINIMHLLLGQQTPLWKASRPALLPHSSSDLSFTVILVWIFLALVQLPNCGLGSLVFFCFVLNCLFFKKAIAQVNCLIQSWKSGKDHIQPLAAPIPVNNWLVLSSVSCWESVVPPGSWIGERDA